MPRTSAVDLPGCPPFRALCCDSLGYVKGTLLFSSLFLSLQRLQSPQQLERCSFDSSHECWKPLVRLCSGGSCVGQGRSSGRGAMGSRTHVVCLVWPGGFCVGENEWQSEFGVCLESALCKGFLSQCTGLSSDCLLHEHLRWMGFLGFTVKVDGFRVF